MLLMPGQIPNSLGLQSPDAQPMTQYLQDPSLWAKGIRRVGLPLSLLLQSNEVGSAEHPDFFQQLQDKRVR